MAAPLVPLSAFPCTTPAAPPLRRLPAPSPLASPRCFCAPPSAVSPQPRRAAPLPGSGARPPLLPAVPAPDGAPLPPLPLPRLAAARRCSGQPRRDRARVCLAR
nr:protein enabled homolog [Aegilops tauschii subsp. strangulata]